MQHMAGGPAPGSEEEMLTATDAGVEAPARGMNPVVASVMVLGVLVLALFGVALGVAVSALNAANSNNKAGPPGPMGLQGQPGSNASVALEAANGLTVEETASGNFTLSWNGTLEHATTIVQYSYDLKFLYGAYTEMNLGRLSVSPTTKGGAFSVAWNGEVAVTGALLLDDGSKRTVMDSDCNNMLEWVMETPLTYYQQFAELSERKRELHRRAIVGIQSVSVHGNAALDDLSLSIAQSFGAALINLDPSNNNAQIVATDFGISLNTQQTGVEFNLGNGDLYVRNLDADTNNNAPQAIVRDQGSQQVFWTERVWTTVYTDGTDPNSATQFSLFNPVTSDDPSLHANDRYYYVSTGNGFIWRYADGSYSQFFGRVPGDNTRGSVCSMFNSAAQDISGFHFFDQVQLNWGPTVLCDPTTGGMLLRNGGIYEVTVVEYLDTTSDASSLVDFAIKVNGGFISGSDGYLSNDLTLGPSTKSASAIVKADGDSLVFVETITSSQPNVFMGPNCVFTARQLYSF